MLSILSLLLILSFPFLSSTLDFLYVTEKLQLNAVSGNLSLAAIADQNADKWSDILLVNKTRTGKDMLIVMLWNIKHKVYNKGRLLHTNISIVSASSSDFDGDGWIDTLVTGMVDPNSYRGYVFWGDGSGPSDTYIQFVDIWQSLPLILDSNGDHLPDIMVMQNNELKIWISHGNNRSFHIVNLPHQSINHDMILSMDYVDINSDCLADVVVTSWSISHPPSVNIWLRDPPSMKLSWSHSVSLPLPSSHAVYGHPVFSDLNGDGQLDMALLSCPNSTCSQPQLHILWQRYNKQTNIINCQPYSWTDWRLQWATVSHFNIPRSMNPTYVRERRPAFGDIDLDGYPDMLMITHNSSSAINSDQLGLILMNQHCDTACHVNDTKLRKMSTYTDIVPLSSLQGVTAATFIDLWEDGILDVVLVVESNDKESNSLVAVRQFLNKDHMFLKGLILSGYCYSDCRNHLPLGSILPSAVLSYETRDRNGHKVKTAGSNYRSSTSLNDPTLPYIILGLGDTPNFIEKITIGLAHDVPNAGWYRQWHLLVPNSQVILIPRPTYKPSKWTLQLYLTPSGLIYSVSGVLLALCVGLAGIVLLLHLREKYQDFKERKQARQKFHFNAM